MGEEGGEIDFERFHLPRRRCRERNGTFGGHGGAGESPMQRG